MPWPLAGTTFSRLSSVHSNSPGVASAFFTVSFMRAPAGRLSSGGSKAWLRKVRLASRSWAAAGKVARSSKRAPSPRPDVGRRRMIPPVQMQLIRTRNMGRALAQAYSGPWWANGRRAGSRLAARLGAGLDQPVDGVENVLRIGPHAGDGIDHREMQPPVRLDQEGAGLGEDWRLVGADRARDIEAPVARHRDREPVTEAQPRDLPVTLRLLGALARIAADGRDAHTA